MTIDQLQAAAANNLWAAITPEIALGVLALLLLERFLSCVASCTLRVGRCSGQSYSERCRTLAAPR
jgi:hypothetical protein